MVAGLRTSATWRSATAIRSKSSTQIRVSRAIACLSVVVRCFSSFPLQSSLYYGQETERNRISVPLSASAWTGFSFSSTIVYQVFLPVFTDPTDIDLCLRQLISRLPYLRTLGITAIELFPVEQYECASSQTFCWRTSVPSLSPRLAQHPIPRRSPHPLRHTHTATRPRLASPRRRPRRLPRGRLVTCRRNFPPFRRQLPGPSGTLSPRRRTRSRRCPIPTAMGAFGTNWTHRAARAPEMAGRGGNRRYCLDRDRMHHFRGNGLRRGRGRARCRGRTLFEGVGGKCRHSRDRRFEIPADDRRVSRGH